MEKEDILVESIPLKIGFNWKILIEILIIMLIVAIFTVLLFAVYNITPINNNETNLSEKNETQIPLINDSRINDTLSPRKSLCGDKKCNGTENYTNCPKDCKKQGGGGGGGGGGTPCISDCNGKNCGDDSCGNSCGLCNLNQSCNATGRCVELINCTADVNCTAFTGTCGTGKCNLTTKYCYTSFNLSTTVCRRNLSECDEVEMCMDNSATCGNDLNKSDETACSSGTCNNGRCIVNQCTLYVDDAGTGTECSQINPCSLSYAKTSKAMPGDVVCLNQGSYGNVSFTQADKKGTISNPITYLGLDKENVLMNQITFACSPLENLYLTFENFHIQKLTGTHKIWTGPVGAGGYNIVGNLISIDNCGAVTFDNLKINGYLDSSSIALISGIAIVGAINITFSNSELFNLTNPFLAGYSTNLRIIGNNIHHTDDSGLGIGNGNVNTLIESNYIHDAIYNGDPGHPGGSGIAVRSSGVTIRNNTISGFGQTRPIRFYQGVYPIEGYQNMIVEGNVLHDNSPNDWAEFIDVGSNCIFRNNTFLSGAHFFLVEKFNGSSITIRNNIFNSLVFHDYSYYDPNFGPPHGPRNQTIWDNVNEGNNIFGSVSSRGCGYYCIYDSFSVTSNSIAGLSAKDFLNLFVNLSKRDFTPSQTGTICNGSLWSTPVGKAAAGALPCSGRVVQTTSRITQYGINWTFDKEYEYGTFANGDYWVVGPVKIININPMSQNITKIGRECSLGSKEYDASCEGNKCKYTRVYLDSFYPSDVNITPLPLQYINSGQNCLATNVTNCTDNKRYYQNIGCQNGNHLFYRIKHGSMINPNSSSSGTQGYDSEFVVWNGQYFNGKLNIGRPGGNNISSINPLILQAGSSLISAISLEFPTDKANIIKTAAILTVLQQAAPEGSFRPAYSGSDKTVNLNVNMLNYSILKKLPIIPGTNGISAAENNFSRPWIDHMSGWLAGALHPVENMPGYGQYMSQRIGEAAMMLNLNYTNEQKKNLLIRYTQLGIDFYGIYKSGISWGNDGGHASGRKWPILFAGLVLNNPEMKSIGEKSGDYILTAAPDYIHFGEDDQTFYVSTLEAATNKYNSSDIGLPEWGITHASGTAKIYRSWYTDNYRTCCTATAWNGFILAAHVMGVKELWNHDVLFDYMDRYVEVQGGNGGVLWEAYRDNYGCTWKRDNSSNIYSQGHYNCSGQNVRCASAQSTVGLLATSCLQYPNQRACDYDPCNLACNGNCGISGSVATEKPAKKGIWEAVKNFFN